MGHLFQYVVFQSGLRLMSYCICLAVKRAEGGKEGGKEDGRREEGGKEEGQREGMRGRETCSVPIIPIVTAPTFVMGSIRNFTSKW